MNNFQFTSKAKRNLLILIGLGLVLFVYGFMNENHHLYTTGYTDEGIKTFQEYDANPAEADFNLQKAYKAAANEKGATNILVEYYHEMPLTKEELIANIKAKAAENDITIDVKDLKAGHGHDAHAEEGAHHELQLLLTPHALETEGSHGHDEHAEEAGHGDGHGAVHHSPMETLEHIIHEEGTFKDTHHARTWSNLLVNAFFFFGIGLGALFFIALQYATESGWGVVYKRILEGIIGWLPVGAIFLIIVFIGATFGWNHIYHWMDPNVSLVGHPDFDPIIANKAPFLSKGFFWGANVVYFGVFLLFARGFRKRSLQEDKEGGMKIHMKNFAKGAFFLVLFGYLSSVMSWHWIMSIDTHWFSTLFGWYVFSGMWISAVIFILLLTFWLKSQGYAKFINESHIHDMGKWMFAISFLWTYLFFSQFMLIWYANIPEEVTYYITRFGDYKWLLWTMVAMNFLLPMI
ncbi:MAG TPA: hypothetical protein EYG86_03680, partial [Crocinitomicaceae bacterium]|nr:hypothetical protein [Crocinitomicaceae bacterium]